MALKDHAKGKKRTAPMPIDIPGWPYLDSDGEVINDADGNPKCRYWVRRITVGESTAVFNEVASVEMLPSGSQKITFDAAKMVPALLFRALSEENGTRMFGEHEREDFDSLESVPLGEVFAAAQKLNPMGSAPVKNS